MKSFTLLRTVRVGWLRVFSVGVSLETVLWTSPGPALYPSRNVKYSKRQNLIAACSRAPVLTKTTNSERYYAENCTEFHPDPSRNLGSNYKFFYGFKYGVTITRNCW